ncbi:MAG: polysaccharide biosynthesis C-terminal domain-containing protein, partial [Bacteroidales bacterium]|nr:polysaccharide biosynthesis C-terminal domain-containing protein [Bacteroidales bacterium]
TGDEVYGSFFSLLSVAFVLQIFLDFGLENFNRKELAQNPNKAKELLSFSIPLKLLLAFVYLIFCAVIGLVRNYTVFEWYLFGFLVANTVMASAILYLRANMGGLQLFKMEGIISVLDKAGMILICGMILYTPLFPKEFKIEWFVYSQSLSYLITLTIAVIAVLYKTGLPSFHFETKKYLPLLKQLLPFALLVLLQATYFRIDSILLEELIPNGKQQAGVYAHGFRIIEFLSNYAILFPMLLLPMFSNMIKEKQNPIKLLQLGVMILIIPSIILLVAINSYRHDVFSVLYVNAQKQSADVFFIISLSFIGMCVSYTYGALLTANNNLRELIYMSAGAVVLSISLNVVLIPHFEVMGAALANGSAQLLTIVIHILLVHRQFKVKTNYRQTMLFFVFILSLAGLSFVIKQFITNYIFGILAILFLGGVLGILTRLLDYKSFLQLVKNRVSN